MVVPNIDIETKDGTVTGVYAIFTDNGDEIEIRDQEFIKYLNGRLVDGTKIPDIPDIEDRFIGELHTTDVPEQTGGLCVADSSVNHPKHYNSHPSGIECIEIAEWYDFNVGNAIKYLWRHGLKTEEGKDDNDKAIEDLEKASWYIENEIRLIRKKQALKQCEENKIH